MDNKEEIKSDNSLTNDNTVLPNQFDFDNESIIPLPENAPSSNLSVNDEISNKEVSALKVENNIFPSLEPTNQIDTIASNQASQPLKEEVKESVEPQTLQSKEESTSQGANDTYVNNASLNGTDQVVFEYKKKKEKSIIPILIFFVGVLALIVFLPNIQEALTNFKNGRLPVSSSNNSTVDNNNNDNNNEVENEPIEDQNDYYDLSKDTIISVDKLLLSDFAKEKNDDLYYLTFNIENKDNAPYNYQEKIYIQMYSNNELLGNALLEDKTFLPRNSKKDLRLIIPEAIYTKDFQIDVKKLKSTDYPDVSLTTNLEGQQALTCQLGTRIVQYTFLNNELIEIDDKTSESNSLYSNIEQYNNVLAQYQSKANSYNSFPSIRANITNNVDSFDFDVKIDASSITSNNLSVINERAYYLGKTNAKEISYEMFARGYTCK